MALLSIPTAIQFAPLLPGGPLVAGLPVLAAGLASLTMVVRFPDGRVMRDRVEPVPDGEEIVIPPGLLLPLIVGVHTVLVIGKVVGGSGVLRTKAAIGAFADAGAGVTQSFDGPLTFFGSAFADSATAGRGSRIWTDDGDDVVDLVGLPSEVVLGAGNDILTIRAPGSRNGQVIVFGGLGDDTVNALVRNAQDVNLSAEGGAGNDLLAIDARSLKGGVIVAAGDIGSDVFRVQAAGALDTRIELQGGTGADVFTFEGQGLIGGVYVAAGDLDADVLDIGMRGANGAMVSVFGGAGDDRILFDVRNGTNVTATIDGGEGDDLIVVNLAGAGGPMVRVFGGAGDDRIRVMRADTGDVAIDAGLGRNKVSVEGTGAPVFFDFDSFDARVTGSTRIEGFLSEDRLGIGFIADRIPVDIILTSEPARAPVPTILYDRLDVGGGTAGDGELWFDPDGSGPAGQMRIATILGNPILTPANFVIGKGPVVIGDGGGIRPIAVDDYAIL